MLSFSPVVGIGTPHPLPAGECPPLPLVPWGGRYSLGGEGCGSPNSDETTYTVVLYICMYFVLQELQYAMRRAGQNPTDIEVQDLINKIDNGSGTMDFEVTNSHGLTLLNSCVSFREKLYRKKPTPFCCRLKGTVSGSFKIVKMRRYLQVKVHHRCQQHRWQIFHRFSRTPAAYFATSIAGVVDTGVNDTGKKFASGVNNTGGK